jgi:hypothetical protein
MTKGLVKASVLTDIANAIRAQNGSSATYTPAQMAAAVAALDGSATGVPLVADPPSTGKGYVDDSALKSVAEAIRAQNGATDAYEPGKMAAAILALEWGSKLRCLVGEGGTVLEFTCLDNASSSLGSGVEAAYDVELEGYSSSSDIPWRGHASTVKRIVFDDSVASVKITSTKNWFLTFGRLEVVEGFGNIKGLTDSSSMFNGCWSLDTVYGAGFDGSGITTVTSMFYNCWRLVGGAASRASNYNSNSSSSAAKYLNTGDDGVLTDPANDNRTWFRYYVYEDGAVFTLGEADPSRSLVCSGKLCASTSYNGCFYYDGPNKVLFASAEFAEDLSGLPMMNLSHLFYGQSTLTQVKGLPNVPKCAYMNGTFQQCKALTKVDLRGFDPSALQKIDATFSTDDKLVTILVDSTFAKPSACWGSSTFYGCYSLVGGNGTKFSGANTGGIYFRIDKDGEIGYLTAA